MEYFYAPSVFFFQSPAFATPEEQVDDDGIVSSESESTAYFFASEDVFVHRVESLTCLVDPCLNVVAVVEFRSEGGAQVFKLGAVCKEAVFVYHDFLCVINGWLLAGSGDIHGFCFRRLVVSLASAVYGESKSFDMAHDEFGCSHNIFSIHK